MFILVSLSTKNTHLLCLLIHELFVDKIHGAKFSIFLQKILDIQNPEAVDQSCSVKKVFLKISQKSQERKRLRDPETSLKKKLRQRCFPVNFAEFLRTASFIEYLRWLLLIFIKGVYFSLSISEKNLTPCFHS